MLPKVLSLTEVRHIVFVLFLTFEKNIWGCFWVKTLTFQASLLKQGSLRTSVDLQRFLLIVWEEEMLNIPVNVFFFSVEQLLFQIRINSYLAPPYLLQLLTSNNTSEKEWAREVCKLWNSVFLVFHLKQLRSLYSNRYSM